MTWRITRVDVRKVGPIVRKRLAALVASILSLAPGFARAQSQRGGTPRADTPRILVATVHSSDPQLGIQAADEIRRVPETEHAAQGSDRCFQVRDRRGVP